MFKLSQETIAIVTVGITLAGMDYFGHGAAREERAAIRAELHAIRAEARADREAIRDEARADRADAQAAREAIRAEGRADREAWQAEMRALREDAGADREAVSRLSGIVEQMRTASR